MQRQKRGTLIIRDASTGRFQVEWRAANAVVSDKGAVTISARDALNSEEVKSQLEAVKRIREASVVKIR